MVFELESLSDSICEFTMQLDPFGMQEEQNSVEGNRVEKVVIGGRVENWQERESLADLTRDNLLWTDESLVPSKLNDDLNCVNPGALVRNETYPEVVELLGNKEDVCQKYLNDDPYNLNVLSDSTYGSLFLCPIALSSLENLRHTASREPQSRLLKYTSDDALHKKEAWFSQTNQFNSERSRYPVAMGENDCSIRHHRTTINHRLLSTSECPTIMSDRFPCYLVASRYDTSFSSSKEKASANNIIRNDSWRSQCSKCSSNVQESLKHSSTRNIFDISTDTPYLSPEGSSEFSDIYGKQALENVSELNGNSMPTSLTEFDVWRQEINSFLKQYGLSRREFAKAAKIGKNTVGKYLSGQCKKLSREIVWKILRTYQTLQNKLPLLQTGQVGSLEVSKGRRNSKIHKSRTIVPHSSSGYTAIETEWDCINRTCHVETEGLEMEQLESSGSILSVNLEEQLLTEGSGILSVEDGELSKEAPPIDPFTHKKEEYILQSFNTADSSSVRQTPFSENDMKQLATGKEFTTSESICENQIVDCHEESMAASLQGKSMSTEKYLSRLIEMQPQVADAYAPQQNFAGYSYYQNMESLIEATTSVHTIPIRIELHLPRRLRSNQGPNLYTSLSKNEGLTDIEIATDSIAEECYSDLSYIYENIAKESTECRHIFTTDNVTVRKATVQLILNFEDESVCENFVLDFPLAEEFIRSFARRLCMILGLELAQMDRIELNIMEQLTEYTESHSNAFPLL